MLNNSVDKMDTHSKNAASSNRQPNSLAPDSSYYYLLFKVICACINKKDELAEEQRGQLFGMWKEYLGICFLESLVFPLRSIIKQHEIYYNTGNYINSLKSSSKLYGCVASPEEAFDVLIEQDTIVRDGILVMANNFLSLKQAIDNSLKEQFVRLCNEAQQGMSDILRICGLLRDESLAQIHKKDIVRVTDENGKELDDRELVELFYQDICNKKKAVLNLKGELPFLHHYSGKKGEERYPITKAIELYKLTLKNYFDTLGSYSSSEVVAIDNLHIKDRILFYKIAVPAYFSTIKEVGLNFDAFIQRWENTYGSDSVWVEEAKRLAKESSDPIIEEPSKAKKGNGTSQCWLKDDDPKTEIILTGKIDEWCRFLMPKLEPLQGYNKRTKTRIKQIARISCSMIYGALEDIGYANDYASGRYGKSFESTIKKTSLGKDKLFRRQDMMVYMKMIHAFKKIMEYNKDDKSFSRHSSIDNNTRFGIQNSANQKDINAEIRTLLLSINAKDDFYWNFLFTNFVKFFAIYKEILKRIKRNLKVEIELPRYSIKKETLSSNFRKIDISFIQGIEQDEYSDEINEMFNDLQAPGYDDEGD